MKTFIALTILGLMTLMTLMIIMTGKRVVKQNINKLKEGDTFFILDTITDRCAKVLVTSIRDNIRYKIIYPSGKVAYKECTQTRFFTSVVFKNNRSYYKYLGNSYDGTVTPII